jgi:hypothetical protein
MQVSSLRSYGVYRITKYASIIINESLNWSPRHFESYILLQKFMCTKIGESRISQMRAMYAKRGLCTNLRRPGHVG